MNSDIAYRRTTAKSFEEAAQAVETATAAHGFRVLHVHDVQDTFKQKGVDRAPLKIVEVCNVKYASRALEADTDVALMMPCKINVVQMGDTVEIVALRPSLLASFFPEAGLEELATEVDRVVCEIVDEAAA